MGQRKRELLCNTYIASTKEGWVLEQICVDCSDINAITVKYRHPIPRLDDMFDELQGVSIFLK